VFYANGTDFGVIEPRNIRAWGIAPPSAPSLTRSTGMLPAGNYRVCCTFVDSRGLESGSGIVSMIDVDADSSITIDNIPARSGYTVNVYVTSCNGRVFYRLQKGAGAALTYNVPPEQFGVEIPFWLKDPPRGTMPALFAGRMYLAEAFAEYDLTVLWRSLPLDYHHFDYSSDGIVVPGNVLWQEACEEALIVGTERAIYGYDGDKLTMLANYGSTPGRHASRLGNDLYFWSLRGLCKAMPFVNLSEHLLSVPPGITAAATVMERDGQRRYVVALQRGGDAYNART